MASSLRWSLLQRHSLFFGFGRTRNGMVMPLGVCCHRGRTASPGSVSISEHLDGVVERDRMGDRLG